MNAFPPEPSPPDSDEELHVQPLEGETAQALDALIEAWAVPEAEISEEVAEAEADTPLDELLERWSAQEAPVLAGRAELVQRLVARVVGDTEKNSEAELRAAREALEEVTRALAAERGVDIEAAAEDGIEEAFDAVGERLREEGLEQWNVSLHLAFDDDLVPQLAWTRIPSETAHVWLLGSLYDRVEASLGSEPLLLFERRASRWWFERWSTGWLTEENPFARGVREQEWSFVERPALALDDVPVIFSFCSQDFFEQVPPRQQKLARALRRSFVDVFAVRKRGEEETILDSLSDGRRYPVHEHNPEIEYRAGFLALGRLIPWDGGRYLRSPGMVIFQPANAEQGPLLAEGLAKAGDEISPTIAIEALLSTLGGDARVPRRIPPASSRALAEQVLLAMRTLLDEAGLVEHPPVDEAPEEIRAALSSKGETEYLRYEVDPVIAEWLQALGGMVQKPETKSKAGKKKGKGKQRGKRKKQR